jgi:hypothetical protein
MSQNEKLRRRLPRREVFPRVLIVCEGIRTELGYFRALRHIERIPIELEIFAGGTPKTLVGVAVKRKKEAELQAKRSRDPNSSCEQVWCVFDVDEHPYLAEAKQQAADNGIQVALSNPCFELWVLLHFRDQRAYIEREKVQRECRKHLPGFDKRLPCEVLLDKSESALTRSKDLDSWQRSRGNSEGNPYTGVFILVERLRQFRA